MTRPEFGLFFLLTVAVCVHAAAAVVGVVLMVLDNRGRRESSAKVLEFQAHYSEAMDKLAGAVPSSPVVLDHAEQMAMADILNGQYSVMPHGDHWHVVGPDGNFTGGRYETMGAASFQATALNARRPLEH